MTIENGMEQKIMTSADFLLSSTSSKAILLPYTGKLWGELCLKIIFLIGDAGYPIVDRSYDEIVQSTAIEIGFNIQPRHIRLTAFLHVKMCSGCLMDERIFLEAEKNEIITVLDNFFENGGEGLNPKYCNYFFNNYRTWKKC